MFIATQQALAEALGKVLPVIDQTPLNEILSNALLRIDGQELEIVGSDGQVQVQVRCPIKIEKNIASFTVNARKFNNILHNVTDKELQFNIESGNLIITNTKNKRFRLSIRDGDIFPRIANKTVDLITQLPQKKLHEILKAIQAAISTQQHRIYLAGAYFDFLEDGLHIVATDGHRLATDVVDSVSQAGNSFILPRKAVAELLRQLNPNIKDDVQLTAQRKSGGTQDETGGQQFRTVTFTTDTMVLSSQLITGKYPDYAKVIPSTEENSIIAQFTRTHLLDCLRQATTVHDKTGDAVRMTISGGDTMELSAQGMDGADEARVEVPVVCTYTDKFTCQLNASYLTDVLKAYDAYADIKIHFKDDQASLLCVPDDNKSSIRYVVMPVR